jgi:septal ring factor EnvC (AmiA/AmiB activator)
VDGWDSILTALPGVGGYGGLGLVLVIAIRMVVKGDSRYNKEVADHEATQKTLDDERSRRRKAEDDLGEVKSEVRALKGQVTKLEARVAELTQALP